MFASPENIERPDPIGGSPAAQSTTGGLRPSLHPTPAAAAETTQRLLFRHGLREIEGQLRPQAPLVVALDDTLVRKSGPHIFGVGYKRDPLGPAFQTNLVRGQRF